MLLESIKLKNFRQFVDEKLEFAKGESGKNVTIIIGENGSGKTTFAQAFFWCFYGETEFSDKNMLNKTVAKDMTPGRTEIVSVEIRLKHSDINYRIIREQTFKKEYNNRIKAEIAKLQIEKKDLTGNTSWVKENMCAVEIKEILPKELSRYFFFDGERIEKMSKDISSNKKSNDFAEAVKGLLGLNAMQSAIEHFKPTKRNSVIGEYDSSFNSNSDKRINEYISKMNNAKEEIETIEKNIEICQNNIEVAKERKAEKEKEIKKYDEGRKQQKKREKYQHRLKNAVLSQNKTKEDICKIFNNNMSSFFTKSLIKRSLELIADSDLSGVEIPYMHVKTIDYLIARKECICGTKIQEGSEEYENLIKLANYLPPKSISSTISEFKKDSRSRISRTNMCEEIKDKMDIKSRQEDDINAYKGELSNIDKLLSGQNIEETVRKINKEISVCTEQITHNTSRINTLNIQLGRYQGELERVSKQKEELMLSNENNRKIAVYKKYAEEIYRRLCESYNSNEEIMRKKLQYTINDIFKDIYRGGLSLTIDEKYHITVNVNSYEGEVETSTAQSISVIFAFIAGIIKLARENKKTNDSNTALLTSEVYPLVMDAPLSAFDKRRIESVCKTLPNIAEQIVIFIKDTDGELAESYIGDKIGKVQHFNKINEFETKLV